uniref:G-protein coupled receptors family 1 profile domain-containing protein n=1 Tax=Ascaris lumbricoides TaxID=6252 RepID=A0A9J2P9G7_ASCLU
MPIGIFRFDGRGGHWVESILAILAGQISNAMYYSAITMMVLIAVNRFCAISLSTRYARIFTNKCAIRLVITTWIIYLSICSIYHVDGCSYIFDRDLYIWHFGVQQCGLLLSFYMDYLFGLIIVIASVIVDAFVLIRLLSYTKVANRSNGNLFGNTSSRRRRREMKFFIQSCLYTAIFVIGLTLFHVVSQWQSTALQLFACITVVWMSALALCGFVFIAFNWRHLFCLIKPSTAITNVTEMGKTNTSTAKRAR